MDHFDLHILDLVQRNNLQSHAAIGDQVGLSGSAVRRRLTTLHRDGVISADVSIINPAALPSHVTVIVAVTFERETPASTRAFRAQMIADPQVIQCWSVAGQFDFMMVVHASDPSAYEAWGERALLPNPDIRRYDSFVVWSSVKHTTALPLGSTAGVK